MAAPPSQRQAHLIVAAVRVLEHKLSRPPSVDEIAELLEQSREVTGHLIRALEPHGIVRGVKGPFDVRVHLEDPRAIDTLPTEESGPGFQDEVEAFHERFAKKQEELQNLFDSKDFEEKRKKRIAGLEEELKKFKSPRARDPFGDNPGESS